ncbi:MAG: hypothetical protein ACFCAD_09315 [Pleurocapsa sp.]
MNVGLNKEYFCFFLVGLHLFRATQLLQEEGLGSCRKSLQPIAVSDMATIGLTVHLSR